MRTFFLLRIPIHVKRWLVLFCVLSLFPAVQGQVTLYTYQSGSWNTLDVWTTDPGGTTLVGSRIPGDGDAVVVLSSRTLTLTGDINTSGHSLTIQPGAVLDAGSYTFSNPLTLLSGQGIYRLSSPAFPSSSTNDFNIAGGGTVEYYGSSDFNFPPVISNYFHLKVNCSGAVATQINNLTIHGNLTIQSGSFRINDGTATRRTLIVDGNVEVNPDASITVGNGSTVTTTDPNGTGTGGTAPFLDYYTAQSHRVEINGDLINNGTIRFTNQSYPVYNLFPNDGFASVFFRGGSDNTITSNGTTDFYNLIVDKGSDETFILTINSAGYNKFRLFGANIAANFASGDANNPNIQKSLWIRNGTLRLNGYTFIPSLTEGGDDFFIPGKGALVLGSPDVVVMGTIDDYSVVNLAYGVNGGTGAVNGISTVPAIVSSSLSLYGKLQVIEGRLYIGEAGNIVYFGTSSAQFVINGGIIDIKQFQSVSGGGKTAFWQTGGTLILRGRFRRSLQYTSLNDLIVSIGDVTRLNTARASYDGTNPLGTDPAVGTLDIDQDANIFHMEGGDIKIFDVTGSTGTPRAIEINSEPSSVSVTGGNITVYITSGTVLADASYGIASKAPIFNLTLVRNSGTQSGILRSIPAKDGVTANASPPLRVLNNLILANNSASANDILNTSDFSVITGGNFTIQSNAVYNPGNNRTIMNGTADQTFTNSGTITSGLHRLVISKTSGSMSMGSNLTVRDSLVIMQGTLNDGGNTLSVGGNVYNGGIHSGTGKLVFSGSVRQYITAGGSSLFGNIVLMSTFNTDPYQSLNLNTDISVSSVKLAGTRGILYLADKGLTIRTQGILLGNSATNYSATKMFMTDGSHSAKGINLFLSLTGNLNTNVDTIPLGVYHSGTTPWYTPAIINVNGNLGSTVYTGTVNVTPIDYPHPSNKDPNDVLAFYWKTISTGTIRSITPGFVTFRYYNGYISAPSGSKHYHLELGSSTWVMGGNYANPLSFNPGFISGAFTAGKNNPFNGPLICRAVASGFWDQAATWTPRVPLSYDYAVIGGSGATNYTVTIRNSNTISAGVSIWANGIAGDSPKPTLIVNNNLTGVNLTTVGGGGKFILKGHSTVNLPSADFDAFCLNDTAIFEFDDFNSAGGNYPLPSGLTVYPNLHITITRQGNYKSLPDADITVRKNLRLYAPTTAHQNKLVLSSSAMSRSFTVLGDVEMSSASVIEFPLTAASKTLNIYGGINFTYKNTNDANAIRAVSGAGATHIFNFYRDTIITGASLLSFYQAGSTNRINKYFRGTGTVVVTEGTGAFSLNSLFIQKDASTDSVFFRHNFSLNETANNTASKSLTFGKGILVLSDPSNIYPTTINLNLSSGGADFLTLNSSSGLILRNGSKINITGNTSGSGIKLDGLLAAEGASEINLADGTAGNTGYIEYSGSGNAYVILNGSSVLKAGQIRRSLLLTTGILNYSQGGTSTSTVYGIGSPGVVDGSRAKLEVTGSGSLFNMTGTASLTIINGGGTTFGDLYLRPETSDVTGGDIVFGTGVSGQVYKADINVPVNNFTINATVAVNEVQLMVNPLVLTGNLSLTDANSRFTSNSRNVTIGGNLISNGTYDAGTNTTLFNGGTQSITGTTDPSFYKLIISPSVKLVPGLDLTIGSDLSILSGTLESGTHNITVLGNIINNGIYTNDPASASRLYLHGSTLQNISGTGSFGRIEIDNSMAGARLGNNLTLTEDLMLTNGVLDINQYSLSLGAESDIITSVFNTGRMIKSDGVFSNGGITKYFSAGYTGTFIYPSGVTGKYTPASLSVSATAAGWVRINVINDKHPATISPFNVLNYYWEAESSISGFDGSLLFNYGPTDVAGDESSYVAGRLVIPPGTSWSKAASGPSTDNVNEAAHTIFYNYPSGTTNLGGHYTAGYPSDLPNNITVYTSNASGDWNISANWSPAAPAGGPNGQIVVIKAGDVISTNGNKRFAFKTTIDGTLVVGTSYGHNLGTVDGIGTLSMSQANLPAGNFNSFLGCSGGTLEYDGGSYTIVADRIDTVRNLIFKGSGTKKLPDKNLVVCNLLEINGTALENYFNRKLSIGGSFILTSGSFLSGSGSGATVTFNGSSPQTVSGFRSANPLNNLEINNAAGLTLNSAIMIKGNLLLTNGIINTNVDSLLKMTGTTSTATAGNSSSHINGPLSKNLLGGVDFTFPTGKNGRYGSLGLITPQSGIWEAEYYNASYPDVTVAGTLVKASATEYWIKSPANGKTTVIKLRWDDQSDITPVTTSGGINDIRVAEYDGSDWREKLSAPPTGNDTNGNVQTSTSITVNNSGHPIYYTLGSVSTIKPVIMLGIPGSVCRCVTTGYLPYLGTMGNPDQYTIDYNAAANAEGFVDVTAWTAMPASPVSLSLPVSTNPGIYTATIRVRSSLNPGNVSVPYAFQLIVLPDISWTGASGPDWNISGNWSCPFLPDLTMPVIIPDVANEPLIAAGWTGTVKNLTILPGSSLTVEGTLAVSGIISNGGTFTATLGQIEFNGTGSQVIPAGLFSGNRIKNLTISNASGVVLQGPLGVTGIMNIINGEFQSGGNLILVSDNNSTALIDGSGSGNVTGNVTMQRYLSTSFGYKYFSSPFQAAAVSEFANEIDLNNWFPLIYAFDENRYYLTTPLDPFYKYVNPAGILNPLEGFALNLGSDPAALTVDITGVVNNGFISRTLYNHNHLYATGRNLVGNPYPSPIDWNAPSGWTKTNIDDALYYFNAGGADEWEGTYSSYINGVSSDGVASNIIASMQGFMVHVSDGTYPVTGTLAMDNQVRVTASNPSFIKGAVKLYEAEKSILRLGAAIEDYNSIDDPLVIYFDDKATGGFDSQLDALKYFNTDYTVPSFFSFGQDGSKLSINAIPLPQEPIPAIPLGYKSDSDGEVIFRMLNIEGPYSWNAINFYDAKTGESRDLSAGGDYRVYLTAGEYNNRFFLNFDGFATGSPRKELQSEPFRVYSSHGLIFADVFMLIGDEGRLLVHSITGQVMINERIYAPGRYEIDPGLKDGVYIVCFVSGDIRVFQKIIIKH